MAPRPDREPSWFRLPHNWIMDENLIGLPEGAKLLFVQTVEFCDSVQNGGTLSTPQLQLLSRGFTRGRQCIDRLLASGALIANTALTDGRHTVSIANAERWLPSTNGSPTISAAKKVSAPAKTSENVPHAGARKKTDRQTDREEERTPSGSVRSSSAQAAPRVAGGAAQPAPDEGRKLSGAEAMAQMREQIKKTQATNPNSTGRDIRFSKYDPNRPIEPINSAMKNGWTDE